MTEALPTLLFVAIVLGYSLWQGFRHESSTVGLNSFFLMNKSLHAKALGTSFVASNISVATVVLALGVVGYNFGFWGAVWITICWISGILLFAYLIGKEPVREYLRVGHTLHEFIGEHYDQPGRLPIVRLAASALTVIVFWGTIGIEFFAGFLVFTKLGGGPSPMLIALVIAAVIILYTIKGGYRAATIADWPRLILVCIGFLILGVIAFRIQQTSTPGAEPLFSLSSLSRIPPVWAFASIITLVPVQLSGMDMWQRCVAAEGNISAIRRGLFLSLPLNLLWLVPAYVGALAKSLNYTPAHVNYVVLEILDQIKPFIGQWWEWIVQPLLYGSLVATMASTIDTLLMSLIFTFMYDMYGTFKRIDYSTLSETEEADLVVRSKFWTGMLGLSSLFIVFVGLFMATLYDLIVTSFALQIILFCPVLFVILTPKRDLTKRRILAFIGLAAGFFAAIGTIILYLTMIGDPRVLSAAPIAAFAATLIFYLILVLLSPKAKESTTIERDSESA